MGLFAVVDEEVLERKSSVEVFRFNELSVFGSVVIFEMPLAMSTKAVMFATVLFSVPEKSVQVIWLLNNAVARKCGVYLQDTNSRFSVSVAYVIPFPSSCIIPCSSELL